MARGVVQSLCRIPSRVRHRTDHARRRETRLVSQATFRALAGLWRSGLDVFWRDFSALVWNAAESVVPTAHPAVAPYPASVAAAETLSAETVVRRRTINPMLITSHFHQRRSPR